MTDLCFDWSGKGLLLEGSNPKIENKQVPGMHRIHGGLVFTDPWMVDFYGFHVSVNIPGTYITLRKTNMFSHQNKSYKGRKVLLAQEPLRRIRHFPESLKGPAQTT